MGDLNGPLGGTTSKDRSELYMAEEPDEPEINHEETNATQNNETKSTQHERTRLLELANNIQAQVTQIQKYLTETNQPNPRFEASSPAINWDGADDIRSACLENLTQLQDLLMTPRELLQSQTPTNLVSRQAIDRFKLHRAIPLTGSRTYSELSWSTLLPVKTLRRILRHAISQRIFYEPTPGAVAHTHASALLAENAHVRDYYGTICNEVWPAATRLVDAVETWPGGKGKDESGYQLVHGRTLYQSLAAEPAKQARYDSAAGSFADDRTFSLDHLIKGFDWAGLGDGLVVDIGGGIGSASKALAKAFPRLTFVVQDREHVVRNAVVENVEIRDRIKFMAHDFHDEQPVKDADVYFFRRVMMEWTDEKVAEILRALKPALKRGALVQIQDPYLPEPGASPLWQERKYRDSDLLALAIANAAAPREVEEWEAVFKLAGPGFEFQGMRTTPESNVAFIEAVWRGVEMPEAKPEAEAVPTVGHEITSRINSVPEENLEPKIEPEKAEEPEMKIAEDAQKALETNGAATSLQRENEDTDVGADDIPMVVCGRPHKGRIL